MKLRIAVLIMLVIAAFSMGCAQKKISPVKQTPAPTPAANPTANPNASSNLTQLEKTLNSTLVNVDQMLKQLNEIDNVSFTV